MTNHRYSPELRQRAVRMVLDRREDFKSEWATVTEIAKLFGMAPETLRTWVRRTQIDEGVRPGLTTDERALMKQLQRENKDLRRANAILKDASIFFATELDGQTKK
jgi:transposase